MLLSLLFSVVCAGTPCENYFEPAQPALMSSPVNIKIPSFQSAFEQVKRKNIVMMSPNSAFKKVDRKRPRVLDQENPSVVSSESISSPNSHDLSNPGLQTPSNSNNFPCPGVHMTLNPPAELPAILYSDEEKTFRDDLCKIANKEQRIVLYVMYGWDRALWEFVERERYAELDKITTRKDLSSDPALEEKLKNIISKRAPQIIGKFFVHQIGQSISKLNPDCMRASFDDNPTIIPQLKVLTSCDRFCSLRSYLSNFSRRVDQKSQTRPPL